MLTLADIRTAQAVLKNYIIRTPLVYSPTFSDMTGAKIYLKLETMQKTGSFKIRGAMFRILTQVSELKEKGVVAASAGNHAQGVAVAAGMAGVLATIVMPSYASVSKLAATRHYGAEVIQSGRNLGESIKEAERRAQASGAVFIHPFDDPRIIAGNGTIGCEILEDLPDCDAIIVPVGGGGLISGIALAAKQIRPGIRIIGVQADACPSAREALAKGEPALVNPGPTTADGISVPRTGDLTFPFIRDLVDEIVLVTEEEITDALLLLLERKKVIAEGAGVTPLAALLSGRVRPAGGSRVALVISGGNIDTPLLERIIRAGLMRSGRLIQVIVQLDDVPGALAEIFSVISKTGGNISHIHHRRSSQAFPLHKVIVEIEIETRDQAHSKEIVSSLVNAGYTPQ